jgi:excisionase family DNA binding protein
MSLADLPPVLTVDEAAKILRLSRGSAYEGCRTGAIPCLRVGRTIRVPTARLLELVGAPEMRKPDLDRAQDLRADVNGKPTA